MHTTRKTVLSAAVAVAALLGGAGAAMAGNTEANYSTTVGKYNGSGYTNYQTKASTGAAGKLWAESVGGNYQVDARLQASSGTGSWARDMGDRNYRDLFNSVVAGRSARVQFSNDASTRVDVQVSGVWRSM